MLKGKPAAEAAAADNATPQFKENPQVNAKIDDYIKNNPKHWEYIQSMSKDRMARALVLGEVQKQDRTERMRAGILRKLDENPELKQQVEKVVKHLPEDRREQAMATIGATMLRNLKPRQTQQTGAPQTGVKV